MEKDSPLVERMRAVSKKAHSLSDALVNSKLVVAFTDPALYGRALQSFWPVFKTIEEKLSKHQDNPSKGLKETLVP